MPWLTKRPAPPLDGDDERPSKRQESYSPEEGELDDMVLDEPPQGPKTPPLPAPVQSNPERKPLIAFPFKRSSAVVAEKAVEARGKVLLERLGDVERTIRDEEPRPGHQRDSRSDRGHGERRREIRSLGDSYRPSADVGRYDSYEPPVDRDSDRHLQDRRRGGAIDSYRPTYDHSSDRRRPRSRDSRRRSRSRSRRREERSRSRTPASRSLGRSDSESPRRDHDKEKHRLPAPRVSSSTFSPLSRYDDDRRSRYDDDDDRSSRNNDRYEPRRERERDVRAHYHREASDGYDHWRPSMDDSYDRRRHNADDTVKRRGSRTPNYRPMSPYRPPPLSSPPTYRPVSPKRPSRVSPALPPRPLSYHSPARTPPPRAEQKKPDSKPPSPTPVASNIHAPRPPIRIVNPLPTRPGAPLEMRSPPSMHLPSKPEPPKRKEVHKPVVVQPKKRVPVKRSREAEKAVYGRVFVGCGQRDDYDMMSKLGEGTFGEVHKAMHRSKKTMVALKRILMHNEKEGMPVTALREIKILKALNHPAIVELLDMFVVPSSGKESPMSCYMVFPYMDHDLAGLLENERVQLQPSQIKLYMKQLLEGTEYMHHNHIVHRDMKAANLLISNDGSLRIADFGLARAFDPTIVTKAGRFRGNRERKYTNCVVTRWYRPPELLLGARQYGGEIDLWGIGCVLGEMFFRRPILPGQSDLDQLDKIWGICGSPNQQNWPDYDKLPGCEGTVMGQIRFQPQERRIKQVYDSFGPETCDLLDKLLTLDPRARITASQALDHNYFWSDPLPADPKTLPSYESSHEFDQRGRRQQPHQEAPHRQQGMPGHHGPPRMHNNRPTLYNNHNNNLNNNRQPGNRNNLPNYPPNFLTGGVVMFAMGMAQPPPPSHLPPPMPPNIESYNPAGIPPIGVVPGRGPAGSYGQMGMPMGGMPMSMPPSLQQQQQQQHNRPRGQWGGGGGGGQPRPGGGGQRQDQQRPSTLPPRPGTLPARPAPILRGGPQHSGPRPPLHRPPGLDYGGGGGGALNYG